MSMTVMEFRTGGPVREPRGPGLVARLRTALARRRGRDVPEPAPGPLATVIPLQRRG